jgi:nucleotide-binding universal stress UspA family protein
MLDVAPGADARQQEMAKKAKAAAAVYLETVAKRIGKQSSIAHTRVAVGANVVAAILQEANKSACDLIAISTHGRGGLPRLLFGSVADKVIRSVNQAVLVCREAQ